MKSGFIKINIKTKLIGIFTIFSLVIISFFTYYSYYLQKQEITKAVDQKLLTSAYALSALDGSEYHDRINGPNSIPMPEQLQMTYKINDLIKKLRVSNAYTMIMEGGTVYFTAINATDKEIRTGTFQHLYSKYEDAPASLKTEVFGENKIYYDEYRDRGGNEKSVFVPM